MVADHAKADTSRRPAFCEQPARGVAFLFPDGRYAPVRCGRSNSCAYCAWQSAVSNIAVVAKDAQEGRAPRHGVTLTTRDPAFDPVRFRNAMAVWVRWLRREGLPVQYLAMIEWTTGRAATSGGHRRMHAHLLVKGIPDESDLDALWRAGGQEWEKLTGAHRVEMRELRSAGGAIAYLVGHHHKSEQAPPPWWSGKRFRPSKAYFDRPIKALRAEAATEHGKRVRVLKFLEELRDNDVDVDELDDEWLNEAAERSAPGRPQIVHVEMTPRGQLYDVDNGSVIPVNSEGSPADRSRVGA